MIRATLAALQVCLCTTSSSLLLHIFFMNDLADDAIRFIVRFEYYDDSPQRSSAATGTIGVTRTSALLHVLHVQSSSFPH
mmetsp:Transcript_19436/g.39346  ORF Transcript_19436/g.39346 Transcript_19436/m.39346 type:complete len:80 (-) Transcript_19436:1081-1320(-)